MMLLLLLLSLCLLIVLLHSTHTHAIGPSRAEDWPLAGVVMIIGEERENVECAPEVKR